MTEPLTRHDLRLATWAAFLRAHARVVRELERELQAEQRMALTDYDVLVQLAAADDRRLRMSELAAVSTADVAPEEHERETATA